MQTPLNKYARSSFYRLASTILAFGLFSFCYSQEIDTLWYEDWEDDNWTDRWNVEAGTWEVGVPESGPGSAYTGERLAATILDGDYTQPVTSRLIRHRRFEVPPVEENPRLRFWHWFSFSRPDYGIVQIRVDDGEWENISISYERYCSNVWTRPSINLTTYAGCNVQIAFYFNSQPNYVSTGWYIDDVVLVTGDLIFRNPEDWELGLGDWYADEGTWEVGIPDSGVGPDTAYTGLKCAATVLGGNYSQPVASRLISPYFVIPPSDSLPRLTFWHWFNFVRPDYGQVQLRTINGNWENISNQYVNASGDRWTPPSLELVDYADSTVQIAFYFVSQPNYVSTGWYIDDIRITGMPPGSAPVDNKFTPINFTLYQNYPNPFNSSTQISFELATPQNIRLAVFNLSGQQVAILKEGRYVPGNYSLSFNASDFASGTYIIHLTAGMQISSRQMILLK